MAMTGTYGEMMVDELRVHILDSLSFSLDEMETRVEALIDLHILGETEHGSLVVPIQELRDAVRGRIESWGGHNA